jgi:uncharacterized protein YtpQ (UPF0354 family)
MGLQDRFFGPPSRDKFAKLVINRLARGGVAGPFQYDREKFSVTRAGGALIILHNAYAEYCRAEKGERDKVMQTFLRSWASTFEIPEEFEDAKPDLLPVLRARTYFEVDLKRIAPDADMGNFPYQIIAEDLCLSLVYDLPTTMMGVTQEKLDAWGVTLYEALEIATDNLRERTTNYAQIGTMFSMVHGDGYDATRLILTDSIARMGLEGEVIAMVPNRDSLLLASEDDEEALCSMLKIAEDGIQHERYISGMALRLAGDEWEPWLPALSHPLYAKFAQLRMQTVERDYESQKELLEAESQRHARDLYIASFSVVQNESTGELISYSVWAKGVPTLLPRTDVLALSAPNDQGSFSRVASASWDTVYQVAGHLIAPQEGFPARFLVDNFPSDDELREIGVIEPF